MGDSGMEKDLQMGINHKRQIEFRHALQRHFATIKSAKQYERTFVAKYNYLIQTKKFHLDGKSCIPRSSCLGLN